MKIGGEGGGGGQPEEGRGDVAAPQDRLTSADSKQ